MGSDDTQATFPFRDGGPTMTGMPSRRLAWSLLLPILVLGCSSPGTPVPARVTPAAHTPYQQSPAPPGRAPATVPTPQPVPPYAIDALRARPRVQGILALGAVLRSGPQFVAYAATWPSMGSTMTGVIDLPSGRGPFGVVVVNHGYVPASQYYVGQDSSKYADALAAQGYLTVSPNYPSYAGSGPPEADVPPIVAEAISDMDLISALPSLPQADPSRVAVLGHSNGGGVGLILAAADDRVRAAVLYAPVSSNMADNARKWWLRSAGGAGPVSSPDTDPTAYQLMSPRGHLPHDGPPTLIMQGTLDEDIPSEWTAATVSALQAAATRTEFVSFPGAMHNFQGADLARANALAAGWLRSVIG
jgi:dienelactone hydrolase